jgi:hypothetical protein
MTTRRDFIRQGALWVGAAALAPVLAERPIKRLWAFPNNPAVYGPRKPYWKDLGGGLYRLELPGTLTANQVVELPPLLATWDGPLYLELPPGQYKPPYGRTLVSRGGHRGVTISPVGYDPYR